MVKCPRCGYENNRKSTYCVNCTYLLKDPNSKKKIKFSSGGTWINMKLYKKIILVLIIILIAFSLFSLIYQLTAPKPEDSFNLVTSNKTGTQQSSSTPYTVLIEYNGSWSGEMGKTNHIFDYSGTGNFNKTLDCSNWDHIFIYIKKVDGSESPLKVTVLQNGEVIHENTTTATNGTVYIEMNK